MSVAPPVTSPFAFFDLRVERRTRISDGMNRLTLTGSDLAAMADNGFDQRIKVILPSPGGTLETMPTGPDWFGVWRLMSPRVRPVIRTYTVRQVRAHEHELDIELVDHGDLGPASRFGRTARAGDRIMVLGPDAHHPGPHGGVEFRTDLMVSSDLLIAGDDSALPAISAILERLDPRARGIAVIETAHPNGIHSLRAPEGIEVRWCVREGERGAAQQRLLTAWLDQHPVHGARAGDPASGSDVAAGGESTVFLDGQAGAYWEVTTEHGSRTPALFAWIAGESSAVRRLRRVLVGQYAVPKSAIAFMGYWREGCSESS